MFLWTCGVGSTRENSAWPFCTRTAFAATTGLTIYYRQTVKIESPDDVERLELSPYAGGRMFIHVTDTCRLSDEILARLRDWATTNGLSEVSIIRNHETLR